MLISKTLHIPDRAKYLILRYAANGTVAEVYFSSGYIMSQNHYKIDGVIFSKSVQLCIRELTDDEIKKQQVEL